MINIDPRVDTGYFFVTNSHIDTEYMRVSLVQPNTYFLKSFDTMVQNQTNRRYIEKRVSK